MARGSIHNNRFITLRISRTFEVYVVAVFVCGCYQASLLLINLVSQCSEMYFIMLKERRNTKHFAALQLCGVGRVVMHSGYSKPETRSTFVFYFRLFL